MELLKAIEGIRTPFWDSVMSAVTYLGDELIFMAGVLLVLWCIDKKWGYRLFIMGMAGTIVNQFLKAIFVVPRPWVRDPAFTIVESAREGASGYSFPSGHTQSAATLFGGVAAWRKDSWRATLICTLLVLLTGFSRMYLGVHTPADVFTSLGTCLVMVVGFSLAFAKAENSRKGKYAIGLGTLALAAAALIYVLAAPKGPGHV
ncbi:MAG: phosphatase PAP2 family protein, partial [Christensenellaceae bacterium]|nr:phosphatase PAP2 family protein [Christensenellaceae bacterium]